MSVVVNRNSAAREISLELKNAQFNNEQGASLLNDAIRGGTRRNRTTQKCVFLIFFSRFYIRAL